MQKATLNLLQAFCLRLEIQAYVPRFPFILLFTTTTKTNLKTQWRKSHSQQQQIQSDKEEPQHV